jgi:hypothetical protein
MKERTRHRLALLARLLSANLVLVAMAAVYLWIFYTISLPLGGFFCLLVLLLAGGTIYLLDRAIVHAFTFTELRRMAEEVDYVSEVYRRAYNPGLGGLFYAVASLMCVIAASLATALVFMP